MKVASLSASSLTGDKENPSSHCATLGGGSDTLVQEAPGLMACPVVCLGRWQDGLRKTSPPFHSRRR